MLTSYYMFRDCYNLVGGEGTVYDWFNFQNTAYAKIDGGIDDPGYFTRKV